MAASSLSFAIPSNINCSSAGISSTGMGKPNREKRLIGPSLEAKSTHQQSLDLQQIKVSILHQNRRGEDDSPTFAILEAVAEGSSNLNLSWIEWYRDTQRGSHNENSLRHSPSTFDFQNIDSERNDPLHSSLFLCFIVPIIKISYNNM
jgi:hypothetical protein